MVDSIMKTLLEDIRYGWRMLRKSPMASSVVIVTLALGIAANTFVFSIVNGYLLRPLPVPNADRIAVIASHKPGDSPFLFEISYPNFVDFRKQSASFADIFGYQLSLGGLSADNKADQFLFNYVTGNYFSALGIKPLLGRLVLPSEEDQPGEQPVLVLGYSYWQKRFGADPHVIGKQVKVNGKSATVIGVVPREFHGAFWIVEMDAYMPLSSGVFLEQATTNPFTDRNVGTLRVLARLKPGVGFSQAQASINVIAARLAQQYPANDKDVTVRVYREQLARPQPLGANVAVIAGAFFLLLAALLLVLACMNVANIVLARATVRQREMALRSALGAGRSRLIRLLLTETLLLSLIGGVGGILVGLWLNPGTIQVLQGTNLPISVDFSFDWKVFAYAFGIAVASGALVGIWPALRASRIDLNSVLQEGGRSDSGGVGRHRMRDILVAAQVAGSLTLLVIAGLFLRSVQHAGSVQFGFDPNHVLTVTLDPHQMGYDRARADEFYRQLETRVRNLPGVQSVSLSYAVPMSNLNSTNMGYVSVEGKQLSGDQQAPSIFFNNIDPNYFGTMRVPLLRGRKFTDFDDEKAPLVAIVNQAMAEQYWPNQDVMGKRFTLSNIAGPKQVLQIVGVVPTGRYVFISESPTPYFFVPLKQNYTSGRTLAIRTSVPPESLIVGVQGEIRSIDRDLPIMGVATMEQAVGGTNGLQAFRLGAMVSATLGAIGLILASVGVYGVVAFAAVQRTREIGIRMALGGTARDVLRLVLRQGIRMVGAGLFIGLLAAWGLSRLIARLLIDVSPNDPLTYATVIVLLSTIALVACWIPARRATRVDPGLALRNE
jgi:predicted permease